MHNLTLSHFLTEVVYATEFWNKNFLKFFTTNLQPHSLRVLSKKNIFQCNFDYKQLFIKINQKKIIYPNHKRQLWIGMDRLISVKYWLNFTKVKNWVRYVIGLWTINWASILVKIKLSQFFLAAKVRSKNQAP